MKNLHSFEKFLAESEICIPCINKGSVLSIDEASSEMQKVLAKEATCWTPTKCPALYKLAKSQGMGLTAVISAFVTMGLVASGIGSWTAGFTATTTVLASANSMDMFIKAIKDDTKGGLTQEATDLIACLFGDWL